MIKKLLIFSLLIASSSISFSQKEAFFYIKGKVINFDDKEELFGATIFLIQKDNLVTKSISEYDGSFLIALKGIKGQVFDLLVSKNGFLQKKILIDLSTLDISDKKQSITVSNKINIALMSNSALVNADELSSSYSAKYIWSQTDFFLKEDLNFSIQFENSYKLSSTKLANNISSSSDNIVKDKSILSDFTFVFDDAKFLFKEKKYKDAYDKYTKAELIINNLSDIQTKTKLLSDLKISKTQLTKLMDSEDQIFNEQLLKAQKNYALGRKGYPKAKIILGTDPMKSRLNDPEIVLLIKKINTMESYFKLKDDAYSLVKSKKKKQEAIDFLKKAKENANINNTIIPNTELVQLTKTLDSLEKIVNPQLKNQTVLNSIPASTQDQGTILLAPGELYTGKTTDAYNDLFEIIDNNREEQFQIIQESKNAMDFENYYKNILNVSRNQDAQASLNAFKNEIDLIYISNKKSNEDQQLELKKLINNSEIIINENNKLVKSQNELRAAKISESKDEIDSKQYLDKDLRARQLEAQVINLENQKDQIELKNKAEKDLLEMRTLQQSKVVNSLDYINFQKDSVSKSQTEIRSNTLQSQKDYINSFTTKPNFIKNQAGVLYEKNKMTEEIFKTKNSQDFVTSIILRRIVVDKNGYGVVYEQTTNENGISFFTLNGIAITERIWFNESTGDNVIEK